MRFLGRSIAGLFLLAVTVGLLGYAAIVVRGAVESRLADEPSERAPRERVFTVETVRAVPARETPVIEAFGQIDTRRNLELRAAAPGRVIWVSPDFAEGGRVAAGDVLVRIDPTDAETTLARGQTDLADAEAELRAANDAIALSINEVAAAQEQALLRERALDRQRDLSARNVGSAAAVDEAELTLSTARQAVLARQQALASAHARLDRAAIQQKRAELVVDEARRTVQDTTLTAAFDGELSDVAPLEGRLLTQGEQLGTLVDTRALEVGFRVSAAQYARLIDAQGALRPTPVRVTLDVAGLALIAEGRLSRAAAVVGEGESGRLVFANLDRAPGFKPGDFVTMAVDEAPLDGVVRLPASAVDAAGTVLVLGPEARLQEAPVTVLRRQGDTVLVEAAGIAGRDVVAARTPLLGAGIRVRPLSGETTSAAAPAADEMLALSDDRRARLRAFVEGNGRMPDAAKTRILAQLDQPLVPARVVERLEQRIGG